MFSEILSENTILNNKYRIVKNLYKDEETSIYLAISLSSEKKFAIKQMDNDKEKTVYETSTFELKEAAQKRVRLDKKANSPEIVDFFTDEKSKYIIIDYTDDSILEKLQSYPSIGKTLKERYIVVRGVSRGGFGSVYLIRDASLPGKYWALKEMHDESNGLEIIEKSFKIEAEMLAKLEHNSIPRVTDFFVDGKRLFLVMDYIKGETLKKRLKTLKDEDYFSEEEIIEWALQICDVLAYLHNREKPIIFRDLKPDNIMITEENRIKLIDFGIARVFEGSKKDATKFALVTEGFAPQEQWAGKADPRSDIYAFGATLFNLITKIHPKEVIPEFPPPDTINENISSKMSYIVLKALETKLSARYQTIDEMKDALLKIKRKKTDELTETKHMIKGEEYLKEEEYLQASFEYMKVLEINGRNKDAIRGIGLCYEKLGLKDKALAHYNKFLNTTESLQKELTEKIALIKGEKISSHISAAEQYKDDEEMTIGSARKEIENIEENTIFSNSEELKTTDKEEITDNSTEEEKTISSDIIDINKGPDNISEDMTKNEIMKQPKGKKEKYNILSVISLGMGLFTMLSCCGNIMFKNAYALPQILFPIVGIFIGIIGKHQIKTSGKKRKEQILAISGIILNILFFIFTIGMMIITFVGKHHH